MLPTTFRAAVPFPLPLLFLVYSIRAAQGNSQWPLNFFFFPPSHPLTPKMPQTTTCRVGIITTGGKTEGGRERKKKNKGGKGLKDRQLDLFPGTGEIVVERRRWRRTLPRWMPPSASSGGPPVGKNFVLNGASKEFGRDDAS